VRRCQRQRYQCCTRYVGSGIGTSRQAAPGVVAWRVDETYVKVEGLYRAIDSTGAGINFLLSALRDADNAKGSGQKRACFGDNGRMRHAPERRGFEAPGFFGRGSAGNTAQFVENVSRHFGPVASFRICTSVSMSWTMPIWCRSCSLRYTTESLYGGKSVDLLALRGRKASAHCVNDLAPIGRVLERTQ
jgi:hypothetical protein